MISLAVENHIHVPDTLYLYFPTVPIVIVLQPSEGGLTLHILVLPCVMRHDAPLSTIQTSSSQVPDCTMNVLCR